MNNGEVVTIVQMYNELQFKAVIKPRRNCNNTSRLCHTPYCVSLLAQYELPFGQELQ